jgi:O-glycosyl hydrolase
MKITSSIVSAWFFAGSAMLFSCRSDTPEGEATDPDPVSDSIAITIAPANKKQEMIGFGGALTWYSNWLTANSKVNEVADLMFTDLGLDIIRLKTWYYPDNYPANKEVSNMSSSGDNDYAKAHWDATIQLYQMAKARDAKIKVLLCSWGPPVSLKDNNRLPEGTLKKSVDGFMYDEFAQYWNDILEYTPFNPDYISIQNEPTYGNSNWTSCKWAITETSVLPGYNTALNKVFDKIKNRANLPLFIGPESQDMQTFTPFVNVLKDNPNVPVLAWHPYNINSTTTASTITSSLKNIGGLSSKPNMMTEFSDNLSWFNTALFIQEALTQANTSAYIYWKLGWATPASGEDAAMISTGSGQNSPYQVTPYYYLIKHFSKNVDAGYYRVETNTSTKPGSDLFTSAFISPDAKKLTVIVVNNATTAAKVHFVAEGKTTKSISVVQSKEGSYYTSVPVSSPASAISLPAKTITTAVLDIL